MILSATVCVGLVAEADSNWFFSFFTYVPLLRSTYSSSLLPKPYPWWRTPISNLQCQKRFLHFLSPCRLHDYTVPPPSLSEHSKFLRSHQLFQPEREVEGILENYWIPWWASLRDDPCQRSLVVTKLSLINLSTLLQHSE